MVAPIGNVTTGQTVFDDRSLRFRSLTLAEADLSDLTRPSTLDGAFKIRVVKRTHAHRDAVALVQRKYDGRGYAILALDHTPRVLTFIAYDEGQVEGTVGGGLGCGKGLSSRVHLKDAVDRIRA